KAVVTMPAMYDTTAFRGAFDGTVTTLGGQTYQTMPADYTPTTDLKGAPAPAGTTVPADQNFVARFVPQTFTGAPKILPISADTRAAVTVKFTVTDSLGGVVSVGMPSTSPLYAAAVQPGVNDVAIGTQVYLNSGHATPWAWSLTTTPSGSAAALSSATAQYPYFVPDVAGKYTVKEGTGTTDIWAGKFVGVITGGSYTTQTFNLNDPLDAEKSGMWYDTSVGAYWGSGAKSATYGNWPVVTPDSGCMACHATGAVVDGLTAPDQFTPWISTAHATFFARGLEGITGNSGTCLTCHTTGYDLAVATNNGGFDKVAAAAKWTYPATRKSGNWAAMFSGGFGAVAKLSNIQCENCHGPQNTSSAGGSGGAHISGVKGATRADGSTVAGGTRVNFSAEVCATCHASGTGHHIYSEWLTESGDDPNPDKGHANLALAQAHPSCGCHSAQAFGKFVDQLNGGVVEYDISISNPPAYTWSAADAQPQTCAACHDPHDATNPKQLRVYDNTPLLPSGYKAASLGKGALCVTCHNMRGGQQCNGTVIASEPLSGIPASGPIPAGSTTAPLQTINACIVTAAGNPTRSRTLTFLHEDNDPYQQANPVYAGVHDATQADVL
ncbi:MAG TPA: cytochrome c3 family protein, partial [Candidatus Acidoferrum sp.]|nr:cytochrome c3 family protein [Candidatus Acidoferrum sp.]